jgi:hypothetical protein
VILGSNHWAPVPADVQSRLLLQQVVSDEGRESPRGTRATLLVLPRGPRHKSKPEHPPEFLYGGKS